MIKLVIANLRPARSHRFVFVCQREHVTAFGLRALFSKWAPDCEVVEIDGVTEGAACTVLAASEHVGAGPLMIANSDQYVDAKIDDYIAAADGCDGLIMTMTASDPKWSFVARNADGYVTRVVEKEAISDEATVGIYHFASGSDFLEGARSMIAKDLRVNGEFYVAPVYNELISTGRMIRTHNVGTDSEGMYGLGTPADLEIFLAHPVADRAVGSLR